MVDMTYVTRRCRSKGSDPNRAKGQSRYRVYLPPIREVTTWSSEMLIGGELYSTVGVETPIEASGHPYQINRTPMANLRHPQHPYAFLERIRRFSSKHYTTEAICMRLVNWMAVMGIVKRTLCLILIEPLLTIE